MLFSSAVEAFYHKQDSLMRDLSSSDGVRDTRTPPLWYCNPTPPSKWWLHSTPQQSLNPKPDVGRKSLYSPSYRRFPDFIAITLGTEKLEWCSYMMVKKFEDMITRFDIIHKRDRQQDGRTYGQTDTARRQRSRLCTESRRKNRYFRPISCFIGCCKGVIVRFLPREVTLYDCIGMSVVLAQYRWDCSSARC